MTVAKCFVKFMYNSAYCSVPKSSYLSTKYRCLRNLSKRQQNLFLNRHFCQKHCSNDGNLEVKTDSVEQAINNIYNIGGRNHRLLLIQPRLKLGPDRISIEEAELKLVEAVTLIQTLPGWRVLDKHIVSITSTNSHYLFGKGNREKLRQIIQSNPQITAVFIGINMLKAVQNASLEDFFGLQVFDRYQIILRIFRDHAHTSEAKLQISLAEIPYLRCKLAGFRHTFDYSTFPEIGNVGGHGESPMQKRQRILHEREVKIKKSLVKLKQQREFLRKSEGRNKFPIIAVVGYTNSGKTALIHSLTNDNNLVPEDKLFATLDVTLHAGFLPSSQKVLYIDTVGFISDVPTTLIQSFHATLEEILLADLIIHIRDVSHPDKELQKKVVLQTLSDLKLPQHLLDTIVEVGNKVDLLEQEKVPNDVDMIYISATKGTNLQLLVEHVESHIIMNVGQHIKLFRIPNGGEEYRWLLKEAAINDAIADNKDFNYLIVEAVISNENLSKFRHYFGDMTVSESEIKPL